MNKGRKIPKSAHKMDGDVYILRPVPDKNYKPPKWVLDALQRDKKEIDSFKELMG